MYVTGLDRARHCNQIFFTGDHLFILFTERLVLVTKSEKAGPSWPLHFWISSPVKKNLVTLATPVVEILSSVLLTTFLGCVPLGGSGSGFLICGVPFEQILFQISDLSNPLWTRIHRITDLSDLQTDHRINDPARSFG